ncbi:MAG TPA: ATP-binding cassette domain-containing protein [Alphaproteobacteria bacterium]|jgi:simple sugar transport system ATP-binding protein|nr:ATP-binding cassette domain-containing protein [Alphaproteobacteria bacterium]
MLLRIEGLHKHYGGVHALDDVSLSVDTGTVIGLVGDNGAGKSTLMKCVTGAEKPDHGSIVFDGQPIGLTPFDSRQAGIEMIYQDLDLCLRQDVTANIFLGREDLVHLWGMQTPFMNHKAMNESGRALIQTLNADIDVSKEAGSLSGGQRQAVAIARALLHHPKLLVMDEPTAALGVREITKVLNLIRSLKDQGITVILISHRLSDIFEVADRIVMMRHGKIVDDNAVSETSLTKVTQRLMM